MLALNQDIVPSTNPNAKGDRKSILEKRERKQKEELEERKENKGRGVVIHIEQAEMNAGLGRSHINQEAESWEQSILPY